MNNKSPHKTARELMPAHGGYRNLKSFQQAELIYDATVKFCDRFIDNRSRRHDQMVQAAWQWSTQYRRGQPSVRHIKENRTQTYWRHTGQS